MILDRLIGKEEYMDVGIELNSKNIDMHLQKLSDDKSKFIDVWQYRQEVFNK